jgi:hypothetical protein
MVVVLLSIAVTMEKKKLIKYMFLPKLIVLVVVNIIILKSSFVTNI